MDAMKNLQNRRLQLAAQLRELGAREPNWTGDDRRQWHHLEKAYDETIDGLERLQADRRSLSNSDNIAALIDQQRFDTRTEIGHDRQIRRGAPTEEQRSLALQAWFRSGNGMELNARQIEACRKVGVNPKASYYDFVRPNRFALHGHQLWESGGRSADLRKIRETRVGLNVGTLAEGGYTVPEGFSDALEEAMLAFGGMRQVAQILTTATGNALPWPTMSDTSNTGAILAEATSIGNSVDPTFGVVTFNAYKYSSTPILISAELLEDSAFDLASVVGNALGVRIGRITNTHFTTGDGSSKPNGLTTAAGAGVTAASATAITADELIDLQNSLDPAYEALPSCGWMFKKAVKTAIRKLKDGMGNYLWQPGLRAGDPDLLLGYPFVVNQDMPAMTTGQRPIVYGAFEKYVIRDAGAFRAYRLEERYRDVDQTGFISFSRHDGDLLDAGTDPVKRLLMA